MRLTINTADALARPHEHAYSGFDKVRRGWVIPRPSNPHVHLRDPLTQRDIFELVVPETAKIYSWATAMPNLGKNRIRDAEQAFMYRGAIRQIGQHYNPNFDVTVPLYIEPDTDPQDVLAGYEAKAWKSGKIYPKNGTTGSDFGVDFRNIGSISPTIKMIEELDMLCLIHGEVVLDKNGHLIVDRFREGLAIRTIESILERSPRLRVVFEHISSKASVQALRQWKEVGYRVEATIAPQYLLWNSSVLFEGGMNPSSFSIPILKDEDDRLALVEFMLEGGGMLGTDSAPHDRSAKSKTEGCAGGLFNEPVGLFVYFHVFRSLGGEDWFEKFVDFACRKACRFYGEPESSDQMLITEKPWEVPALYERGKISIIPMLAGTTMPYSLEKI